MLPTLTELADWLSARFGETQPLRRLAGQPPGQPPGPYTISRLALALERRDLPPDLLSDFAPDALFLHRFYDLGDTWPGLGVLGVHDGFDAQLTTGPNDRLAEALGWREVRALSWHGKRAGLIATPPQQTWPELLAGFRAEFGGEEMAFAPPGTSLRLAYLNAMNPALIEQAAAQGVGVYVTGQVRPSALAALRSNGLGLIALGHRRSEAWGLRRLAGELEAAFLGLQARVYPADDQIGSDPSQGIHPL